MPDCASNGRFSASFTENRVGMIPRSCAWRSEVLFRPPGSESTQHDSARVRSALLRISKHASHGWLAAFKQVSTTKDQ